MRDALSDFTSSFLSNCPSLVTRAVYVIVGDYYEHLGLLLSLSQQNLLQTGHYFVVGVDVEHYDPNQTHKYFYGE